MYSDDSKFPFGKYKGEPFSDVPASYFHWLWHEADLDKNMKEYIKNSISALKEEAPDLIWKNI